jgi:hypothetical protein
MGYSKGGKKNIDDNFSHFLHGKKVAITFFPENSAKRQLYADF